MSFWQIFKCHLARIFKSPALIGNLIILPAGMVLLMGTIFSLQNNNGDGSTSNVATVVLLGDNNQDLHDLLIAEDYEDNIWTDAENAMRQLERGDIGVVYTVPNNFIERLASGEALTIQALNRNPMVRSVFLENTLHNGVRSLLLEKTLGVPVNYQANIEIIQEEVNESPLQLSVMLITMQIFYIFTTCLSISGDLVSFKKNQTLRRAVMTPNSNRKIIISHLTPFVFVMALVNLAILAYVHLMSPLSLQMFGRVSLILLLSIIVGMSICMVMFRIFKEPVMVNNIGMMILIGLVGLAFIDHLNLGAAISNLVYLSPFKWMVDMLFDGIAIQNIVVLLLMAGVLLTAGSYRLESYVNRN